jgi:hypothetical protein
MTDGVLETYSTNTSTLTGGANKAQDVYVTGGDIIVGADLTGNGFGQLNVKGWGLQLGGSATVVVSVSLANNSSFDAIFAPNNFSIDTDDNYTTLTVSQVGTGMANKWGAFFVGTGGTLSGQFNNFDNTTYTLDNTTGQVDYIGLK